jgi:hypothetical protein
VSICRHRCRKTTLPCREVPGAFPAPAASCPRARPLAPSASLGRRPGNPQALPKADQAQRGFPEGGGM